VSKEHEQKQALIDEILKIRWDAVIVEIAQHKLGPGHAILSAKNYIDIKLPTLVSYCDWSGIWKVDLMLKQLETHSGSILTYTGFHPHMIRSTKFAYVKKTNNEVIDIQEKESYTSSPMSEEASAGCYGFATGSIMIEAIEEQKKKRLSLNGEYYISLTYKTILEKGHKVGTVVMDKFSQWGTPEDLQDWIYWNASISALPNVGSERIEAHNIILAAGRGSRIAEVANVSKPNILVTPNAGHLVNISANTELSNIYSTADLSLIDGWPIAIAAGKASKTKVSRVTGSDLLPELFTQLNKDIRIGIIGGNDEALIRQTLESKFPNLNIQIIDTSQSLE
jgi:dTDP-glucose pyrophosphorylase